MNEPKGGRPLRVLHVWNTAGVASVIAKFTDRTGNTRSRVITRKKFDPVGLTTYGKAYEDGARLFGLRALLASASASVVHVHSFDRLLPWVRRLEGTKPLVMHYHGTDILGRWGEKKRFWSLADLLVYSTPNLADGAPAEAHQVPNPVDTDKFHPQPLARWKGTALAIHYGSDQQVERIATSMGLDLRWLERGSTLHKDLPFLFSKHEYFIDIRTPVGFLSPVKSVGKAALEALACGCKVVDWSGSVLQGLPDEHRPENVASRWIESYRRLVRKGRRTGV